jgi:hypothetical protein|tara:strand:- start:96 stop:434 length:339 start_codon:yes stop_codon:yes gene_type:complete
MGNLLIMFGSFFILVGFSLFYDKSYKEGYSRNNVNSTNSNSSTTNANLNARINQLIDEKLNSPEFAEQINIKIENYSKNLKFETRVKDLFDKNMSSSFTNEDEDTFEGYEML